jgi:hypothetical protein
MYGIRENVERKGEKVRFRIGFVGFVGSACRADEGIRPYEV